MKIKTIILFLLIAFTKGCASHNPHPVFIRTSQVGFLPEELKTAVVFSDNPLFSKEFKIKAYRTDKTVFEGIISDSGYAYDKFKYLYKIDFTNFSKSGKYFIEVDNYHSFPFKISSDVFNQVVDSLILFYRAQRCGPTNPILHKPCHLSDATKLIENSDTLSGVDVTGGWHDAGDYIKFLSTSAYTTYMLMFAYEFDKNKFGFDNNKNGVPDLLEEAKVGLDWLLRANYSSHKLITQVQDLRDHQVGWRLPENDTLRFDRPAFMGMGKNQIGLYSATMALGAKLWSSVFKSDDFAQMCLNAAKNIYSVRNYAEDIDSVQSGFYQDKTFWGKLALGAVELYLTTKEADYLRDAKTYADSAGSDYWWSWGDINSLADYKLAQIDSSYRVYLENNLKNFNNIKNSSPFNEGMAYSWGTTNSFLGIALQAILYKKITKKTDFDSLAIYQRDFVLGRNPWGISFIYNIGTQFPKHLHSQIAYFNNGYIPGALTAGPAPVEILKSYEIKRENHKYDYFNSDSVLYFDDRWDYITNEPTIVGNSTALFVFGYFSNRK